MWAMVVAWCLAGPEGDVCSANVVPVYFGTRGLCQGAETIAVQKMAEMSGDAPLLWLSVECRQIRRGKA